MFEVGPAIGDGHALTHGEVRDWQENTGIELSEFEAVALVRLSREYLAMVREASGENAPPAPYRRAMTDDEKRERSRQQIEARKARQHKGKP